MKRITLVLGVVAVMVAMLVALSAPAMAKDSGGDNHDTNSGIDNHNDGNNNGGIDHLDNRLDRLDNRLDVDDEAFLLSNVDVNPVFTTDDGLADELCSPLSSGAINNAIPGCIFGDRNDDLNTGFVSDVDFDTIDFDSDIDFDDVDFVDVDRGIDFATGNNHNRNARHLGKINGDGNGRGGHKGIESNL